MPSSLGKELCKARIDKGLSQKDFAESLGMRQQYISRIEKDKADMRLSTLSTLASGLDLTLPELFRRVFPEEDKRG